MTTLFPQPKATLERYGLRAKRSFGQNFLTDTNVVDRIAALAGPAGAHVVEIGAGLGGLTACLLNRGHRVTAIERDRDMVTVLEQHFSQDIETGRLTLLEADAKAVDYAGLFTGEGPKVLMGNLPYQITGPLLQAAVGVAPHIDCAVFLVQKEVADRLAARPGTKSYGGLTVFCQACFSIERSFVVRRGTFYPQPNVDSAVVHLTALHPARAEETDLFRALVHGAFRERRKVLRNSWKQVGGASKAALTAAAAAAGIDLDARGETLSVEQFAEMARCLQEREGTA